MNKWFVIDPHTQKEKKLRKFAFKPVLYSDWFIIADLPTLLMLILLDLNFAKLFDDV